MVNGKDTKEGVVSKAVVISLGQNSWRSRLKSPWLTKGSRALIIAIVIGLMALLAVGAWYYLHRNKIVIQRFPSTTEYARQQTQKLQQHPPANNASVQTKLSYYDQLYKNQLLAGKYQEAIKTFSTRLSISDSGVAYPQYYQMAVNYSKVGNKTAALQALDKAEQTIPPDNPNTGFYKSDALHNITIFRQELQQ